MNNSQQSAISVSQLVGGCLKSASTSDCASGSGATQSPLFSNWQTQGSGWAQIWVRIAHLFVSTLISKKKKHIETDNLYIEWHRGCSWETHHLFGCLLIHWVHWLFVDTLGGDELSGSFQFVVSLSSRPDIEEENWRQRHICKRVSTYKPTTPKKGPTTLAKNYKLRFC